MPDKCTVYLSANPFSTAVWIYNRSNIIWGIYCRFVVLLCNLKCSRLLFVCCFPQLKLFEQGHYSFLIHPFSLSLSLPLSHAYCRHVSGRYAVNLWWIVMPGSDYVMFWGICCHPLWHTTRDKTINCYTRRPFLFLTPDVCWVGLILCGLNSA